MTTFTYPLSVLARAVAFRNLSSASLHVGLSQPQLSRMIAKLEAEFGMELLDRRVKRKSSWTPQAIQLAELFTLNQRRLEHSIRRLQTDQRARQVHIGTLEGLADAAVGLGHALFQNAGLQVIVLDVFDRSELESQFLAGDLDLIINTRFAGPGKPRYSKVIGYQRVDMHESGDQFHLWSSFEYNLQHRQKHPPAADHGTLVSNSLSIRKLWFERFGGVGSLPSELHATMRKGFEEVFLIGGPWLDPHIWETALAWHR